MSAAASTPWHVGFFDVLTVVPLQYEPTKDISVYNICAADGQHLAYVRGTAADKSIAMTMAAAPELLAMLKDLVDLEGPQPGNSAWGDRALALIAKVESGAA